MNGLSQAETESKVTVVLGTQWGDEGKGRVVDMLAATSDVVCRCQGGNNSDHIIVINGVEYIFHLFPSGITNATCKSVLGNGVVIHLPGFFDELEQIERNGLTECVSRLIISDRAHLVFDFHQEVDGFQEQEKYKKGEDIGTTKKGIGPAYTSKAIRNGIRIGELLGDFEKFSEKFKALARMHQILMPSLHVDIDAELLRYKKYANRIRPLVTDTVSFLNNAIKTGKKILVEGNQASMLDIDFGSYPYVTSSNCTVGGICTGLGIPPTRISEVVGVVKAYTTRIGGGPFPTELKDDIGNFLLQEGDEIGRTSLRKRRCGWLDIFLLQYTNMINDYSVFCLTKLDILDQLKELKIGVGYKIRGKKLTNFPCNASDLAEVEVEYITLPGWQTSTGHIKNYDDLPENAKKYVETIEEFVNVPVKWIGVGKSRESIIHIQPLNQI